MREVKAVTITKEEFAPYGTFYDMTHRRISTSGRDPQILSGPHFRNSHGQHGIFTHRSKKGRSDRKMCRVSHNHLGRYRSAGRRYDHPRSPASAGTPVPQLAKAFLVPKGSMVKINAGNLALMPSAGKQ